MEKYCLQWNDFQSNVSKALNDFRKEEDFFDVTLVSDDQQHIPAHKLVLSASSELFKSILKKIAQVDPFIYLSGFSSKELNLVMDYIYQGEVQMLPDDVANFLDVAQKLKIKGLFHDFIIEEGAPSSDDVIIPDVNERKNLEGIADTNKGMKISSIKSLADNDNDNEVKVNLEEGNVEDISTKRPRATKRLDVKVDDEANNNLDDSLAGPDAIDVPLPVKTRPKRKAARKMKVEKMDEHAIVDEFVSAEEDTHTSSEAEAPGFQGSSYNGSDLVVDGTEITVTAIVDSYIYSEGKEWICKTCGKRSVSKHNMRKHAEIHIDGLSFPCQYCDLSYKTRMSRDQHKKLKHSTSKHAQ